MSGFQRKLLQRIDDALSGLQDVPSSLKWADMFNGGFLPASPTSNVKLTPKRGKLPANLAGAYLRIGPNVTMWPPQRRTHVFDGDGMVHSVRIVNGEAVYHCDYIESPRLLFEREYGREWFLRLGEFWGKSGMAKILMVNPHKVRLSGIKHSNEASSPNTAIQYTPEGKLWALNEGGAPFEFCLDKAGCPKSVGYDKLGGTLTENVSAHPKVDFSTGEVLFHGRDMGRNSYYMARASGGKVVDRVHLEVQAGFHHDMFITKNYMVAVDGSMKFKPQNAVAKRPLWEFNQEAKLRFAVVPRNKAGPLTEDDVIWIEASEAAEIVHTCYGYEDDDGKIVLWTPVGRYQPSVHDTILGDMGPTKMHRVEIDVAARAVKIEEVPGSEKCTEFPRVRDDRIGGRTRYGWSGQQGDPLVSGGSAEFEFTGILKWDFDERRLVGSIEFPEGVIGGEPVFVPAEQFGKGADDEGYIAIFLWDGAKGESTFALYDARTMSPEPVAELAVPCRVPLGFHAHWVDEPQFQRQLAQQS